MGCNCKNSKTESNVNFETKNKKKIFNTISNIIIFLIIYTLTIPIFIILIGYILFKTIVLNNNEINITSLLLKFGKKAFENDDEEEDDDDDDELHENDNYELTEYDEVNKNETI